MLYSSTNFGSSGLGPTSDIEPKRTFTSEWDKDLKYQRAVDKEGFRVVLPQGGYLLTIEAQGYETYKMEIEVDQPNIDLDLITMLTNEQAAARDEKRKKRANRF